MSQQHGLCRRTGDTTRRGLIVMGLTGSFFACIGLLAVSAACAASPPDPTTLYVAIGGSDNSAGSSSAPLRTIGAAVSRAPSNGVVVVRSGSYHESITLAGNSNRTIRSAPDATVWLDGSRIVNNWKASGSLWVAGWTAKFDSSPTLFAGAPDNTASYWQFVNRAHPMAAHPDQVWIDGIAQRQVGSRSEVGTGSFYADYSADQLVLGSSPLGHGVRASDLSKAISIRDPGTTISGINVRRYAPSVPTMGSVTVERPGATLTDMQITDNATSGLQVGSPGAHLSHLILARNGMMGLRANHADGLRLDHVVVTRNNLERFNPAPSAGGAKIGRTANIRIHASQFSHNYGTGLWFDESAYDFEVYGSRISGNTGNGLSMEISGTAKVANNVIADNTADGLKINDTDHVEVWNNSLTGNGRTIDIAQDARDQNIGRSYRNWSLPLTLRSESVTVRNNILADPNESADCLLCVEDHSHRFSAAQLQIRTDANAYQVPSTHQPRWLVVWSRGAGNPAVYTSLGDLRSATGQERRGIVLAGKADRKSRVTQPAATSAYPAPAWLAHAAHVKTGTKHLGAWN